MQALLEGVGPEGAVYASMGTLCNFGPEEFVAIGQALSGLPNLVIWKLAPGDLPGNATVDSLNLSANVKARSCKSMNCKNGILKRAEGLKDKTYIYVLGKIFMDLAS